MKVVGWHSGRQSACNPGDTRDMSFIPELQSFQGEGNGNPLHYLPGKFHGQGRLAGYSPWGHKESDMTECAHTHTHFSTETPKKENENSETMQIIEHASRHVTNRLTLQIHPPSQ